MTSEELDDVIDPLDWRAFDAIRETFGPPKPLTIEMIQEAFDALKKNTGRYSQPMRIVSHAVYRRAEEALADGASEREVEWILVGASREQAKKWAEGV